MRSTALSLLVLSSFVGGVAGQNIVAQPAGIPNPGQVIDFGAGLFPNFTPVSTEFAGITITHARYFTTGTSNNLVGGFLTNDPIGPPDTLSITFAQPITDLSFVYHQIGTSGPSTIRAMLFGTTVSSFSGTWNQTQTNNYFGFTGIVFDELQIDFVGDFNVDTLAFDPPLGFADCVLANGSGSNPVDFTCQTLPVLGTTWQGSIATNASTLTTGIMFAPGGLLATPVPLFGAELLIQATPAPTLFTSAGSYAIPIPSASSWIGTEFVFQGMRLETSGGALRIRPLNAMTLRLGL